MFEKENSSVLALKNLQRSLFCEKRVVFNTQTPPEQQTQPENIAELQKEVYGGDIEAKDLNEDVKHVVQALDAKWGSIIPTTLTTFTSAQLLEGTQVDKGNSFFAKARDMKEGFMSQFFAKSEITQKEYEKLNYEEQVVSEAITVIDKRKIEAEGRKKKLLDLRDSVRQQKSLLNVTRYTQKVSHGVEDWKFNRSEIEGNKDKIKRLQKEGKSVGKRKGQLEKQMESAFEKQLKSKENLKSYMSGIEGVTPDEANNLIQHLEYVNISHNSIDISDISALSKEEQGKLNTTLSTVNKFLSSGEISETERDFLLKALESFLDKKGREYLKHESRKTSKEKLEKTTTQMEFYKDLKVEEDTEIKTKIKVGGETLDAGTFHVISKSDDKIVFIRNDQENKNSVKDLIVVNPNTLEFQFAKDSQEIGDIKGKTKKLLTKKIETMRKKFEKSIDDLTD
ncbi:hypothetical protein HON22_03380, partial [Candidatus Peregrinibacteria bacterium]|nr:hypothetical protein [Candidatus Peregrinibacteria bacterium]